MIPTDISSSDSAARTPQLLTENERFPLSGQVPVGIDGIINTNGTSLSNIFQESNRARLKNDVINFIYSERSLGTAMFLLNILRWEFGVATYDHHTTGSKRGWNRIVISHKPR